MRAPDALAPLLELAEAAFPGVYEPVPWPLHVRQLVPSVAVPREHPALDRFEEAARLDDALRALYEGDDLGTFVMASVGSGWRIQPSELAASLIACAAYRVLFSAGDPNEVDLLLREAERALTDLRSLLNGGEVEALAITGFLGIELDEGATISTAWGSLRAANEFERQVRPFFDDRASPSVILESPIRVTYKVGEPGADVEPTCDEALTKRNEPMTLLPLAALLGVDAANYVVVDSTWTTTVLPGQPGLGYSGRATTAPVFRFIESRRLKESDRIALATWSHLVADQYHDSIAVAVRRTLSAIRERVDAEDALIDAVIATESLFGHGGETEVTFRVSTAVTLLLEPEADRRATFRSLLGKVYKTRSQVVHGGSVSPERLTEHKELAVAVAVRSLRTLFAEQAHLIPDTDRGMHLILRSV